MKRAICLFLSVVALLAIGQVALATPPPPLSTDSDITFVDGTIIINPPGTDDEHGFVGMDIEFGERRIPIRREMYVADGTVATQFGGYVPSDNAGVGQNGPYTEKNVGVLVTDSRAGSTAWDLKVRFYSFADIDSSVTDVFGGILHLLDGTPYSNAPGAAVGYAGTDELQVMNNGTFEILSTGMAEMIMQASIDLGIGSHGVYWTPDEVRFQPNLTFTNIGASRYQAKLYWVLAVN